MRSEFFRFSLLTSWAVLSKVKALRGNSTWSTNCMEQNPCRVTTVKQLHALNQRIGGGGGGFQGFPPLGEGRRVIDVLKKK